MACDIEALMEEISCPPCLSDQQFRALVLKLLCTIATNGTGATKPQVFSGHYGGGSPTQTPDASVTAALAYDLDAGNNQWIWNGSVWQ